MNAEAGQHSATEVILRFCTRCTRSTLSQSHGFPCAAELFSIFIRRKLRSCLRTGTTKQHKLPKATCTRPFRLRGFRHTAPTGCPPASLQKSKPHGQGCARLPVSPGCRCPHRMPVSPGCRWHRSRLWAWCRMPEEPKTRCHPKAPGDPPAPGAARCWRGVTRGRICSANRAPGGAAGSPPSPPPALPPT